MKSGWRIQTKNGTNHGPGYRKKGTGKMFMKIKNMLTAQSLPSVFLLPFRNTFMRIVIMPSSMPKIRLRKSSVNFLRNLPNLMACSKRNFRNLRIARMTAKMLNAESVNHRPD